MFEIKFLSGMSTNHREEQKSLKIATKKALKIAKNSKIAEEKIYYMKLKVWNRVVFSMLKNRRETEKKKPQVTLKIALNIYKYSKIVEGKKITTERKNRPKISLKISKLSKSQMTKFPI